MCIQYASKNTPAVCVLFSLKGTSTHNVHLHIVSSVHRYIAYSIYVHLVCQNAEHVCGMRTHVCTAERNKRADRVPPQAFRLLTNNFTKKCVGLCICICICICIYIYVYVYIYICILQRAAFGNPPERWRLGPQGAPKAPLVLRIRGLKRITGSSDSIVHIFTYIHT